MPGEGPAEARGRHFYRRLEIDEALTAASTQDSSRAFTPAVAHHARWRERLAWSLATALALAAGIALKPAPLREPPPRLAVSRLRFHGPVKSAARLHLGAPDGTAIAVQSSNTAGPAPIYVRRLDSPEFTAVPGSDRLRMPSWWADGASLLTLTRYGLATDVRDYEVARTDISSGHTRSVARLPDGLIPFTVVEGASGVVLMGSAVSPCTWSPPRAAPTPVGVLDAAAREVEQQSPVFLPDGRRFFYTSVREGNQLTARLRSLDWTRSRILPARWADRLGQ